MLYNPRYSTMAWVSQNTTLSRVRPPPPVQRRETEIEIGDDVHELASSIYMLALSTPMNALTLVVASASMARTYALRRAVVALQKHRPLMHIVATVRSMARCNALCHAMVALQKHRLRMHIVATVRSDGPAEPSVALDTFRRLSGPWIAGGKRSRRRLGRVEVTPPRAQPDVENPDLAAGEAVLPIDPAATVDEAVEEEDEVEIDSAIEIKNLFHVLYYLRQSIEDDAALGLRTSYVRGSLAHSAVEGGDESGEGGEASGEGELCRQLLPTLELVGR